MTFATTYLSKKGIIGLFILLGAKEIDGRLVPPGKAYTVLSDMINRSYMTMPKKSGFKSNHPS